MKELLSYIKAKSQYSDSAADIASMLIKFPNKPLNQILNNLLSQGLIYEPRKGVFRYLA
jgi:ABC-type multidrug transport system permease subunit